MKSLVILCLLLLTIEAKPDDLTELKLEIDTLKKEITNMKAQKAIGEGNQDNQIPVGFLYTQLPDQKSPEQLWPGYKWQDVSAKYAGLFFRAVGGNSNAFGEVQDENFPRINRFIHKNIYGRVDGNDPRMKGEPDDFIMEDKAVSEILFTGWQYDAKIIGSEGIQVEKYIGEFRPRNTAVKIWVRST